MFSCVKVALSMTPGLLVIIILVTCDLNSFIADFDLSSCHSSYGLSYSSYCFCFLSLLSFSCFKTDATKEGRFRSAFVYFFMPLKNPLPFGTAVLVYGNP